MNPQKQIFLIDDDNVTNFLNTHYISLHDKAIIVTAYTNAHNALKMMREGTIPDVIFLDINMPEMDGWEFLNEFQKTVSTAKVYMLSSSIDPADINRSKEYSCVSDFLSKPLTNFDLKKIIG
jgi:CheY-like chemotaxis protein